MAEPLTISVEKVPLATIVRLKGSAALGAITELDAALNRIAADRPMLVVMDLSGVDFLASLAMGQFVALHKSLKYHGGRMVLAGPSGNVLDALHLARLGSLIPILPSVDAALWNVT